MAGLSDAARALRANGSAFAALVSAAGRPELGKRSVLASRLQHRPVAVTGSRPEFLQGLRQAAAQSFAAGARGVLVLVSHEAAGFFDDFETYAPWRGLPPLQLWAAYDVQEFPPGPFGEPAAGREPLATQSTWDARAHQSALDEIQQAIARGQCYQVCLTYPITTQVPQDPGATLTDWLARQAVDHAAWIHLPKEPESEVANTDSFELLCCSPERFFSLSNGELLVQPMKGTRRIAPQLTAAEAAEVLRTLATAEKDRAENIMIVDLMRNDMGRVCVAGSVQVRQLCEVTQYASVAQMTSTIAGELQPGRDVWDVLAACFPPGSMTGAPKIEACKWIRRLESGPRGLYGGTIGWLEPNGDAQFNVVIRSLQIYQGEARWDVGGGIVADSTPEAEWLETRAKAALLDP